jgi:DNA-binding transcriptional ArsR family regulator
MNKAAMRGLLFVVICATVWPAFFLIQQAPAIRANSISTNSISISAGTVVPFVIAASFTRITDNDNHLIMGDKAAGVSGSTTRERIFALIDDNPGIHFRDICRRLEKQIGVVEYHVYILKKFGFITANRDGRFTRFYTKTAALDDVARNVIAAWQRPIEKTILSQLIASPDSVPVRAVVQATGVTTQAVTWHLNRLVSCGLITGFDTSISPLHPDVKTRVTGLLDAGIIYA